jgi:pimeloyl-ACP methyl ester carboxylesterase
MLYFQGRLPALRPDRQAHVDALPRLLQTVTPTGASMVFKRHILFVAGFDPFDIAAQYRRFQREIRTYQKTWNASATVSDLKQADELVGHWVASAQGPNWSTQATYEPLAWHDIVVNDTAQPMPPQLKAGAVTFWDFVASGTVARYFVSNYRYALFFMVPFMDVLLFAAGAIAAGWWVAVQLPVAPVLAALVAIVIALAVFLLLMRWPGRRWRVSQGLADWISARDYMYGRHRELAARVEAFTERLLACVRRGEADEILVVGHSLGAIIAVDALARALAVDPQLGRRGPVLSLLTIGATIPKLTLHPAATRLRACVERVAAEDSISWGEFQSRQDPISFFSFDPVALRPFEDNAGGKPHIRLINFRDLVTPQRMRRLLLSFMRVHYQFVMAAERRGTYDFFMLVCGPAPLARAVWAPRGCAELIGDDGSYLQEPAPARRVASDVS